MRRLKELIRIKAPFICPSYFLAKRSLWNKRMKITFRIRNKAGSVLPGIFEMMKNKKIKHVEKRTQKNIRLRICLSVRYFAIVVNPAALYSSPYLIIISQK
jgi:hypothetical protein